MENTNNSPQVTGLPSIFWTILVGLCIFILLFSGIKSCNHKRVERKKERIEQSQYTSTQNTKSTHWEKVGTKTITFGPQYGEKVYLETGKNISFEEATEPYCIMNANNEEFCANKGGDPGLPRGSQNMKLQFKSQNDNNGSVVITFWEKK